MGIVLVMAGFVCGRYNDVDVGRKKVGEIVDGVKWERKRDNVDESAGAGLS
jgi:hypothetical protein